MNKAAEKRTKLVGMRLNMETFECLEQEAHAFETSPTSRARQIIVDHFGLDAGISSRAGPRKPRGFAVTSELKRVSNALTDLIAVQVELRRLSAFLKGRQTHHSPDTLASVQTILKSLQSDLSVIKTLVVTAAK